MHRLFLIATILLSTAPALAADTPISATVDRREVAMGEQFRLQVTLQSSDSTDPILPPLNDFEVLEAGRSQQMRFINGRSSSSVVYSWALIPKAEGEFIIGAVEAEVKGKKVKTRPFRVRVVKTPETLGPDNEIYLVTAVSNPTPFVGEEVLFTLRLYRRVKISQADLDDPDFHGFLVEEGGKQKDFEATVDGQRFLVTEIKKILFPQEAGTIEIPSAKMHVDVVIKGRRAGGFDDFFGHGQTQKRLLVSEVIPLEVRPLPEAPANFSGLVGQFDISAKLSPRQVETGGSSTLQIIIGGRGNVQLIKEPKFNHPDGLKIYDDKPQIITQNESGTKSGQYTFSKALVPLKEGVFDLGQLQLVYFDPKQETYITRQTAPLRLMASGSAVAEQLRLTSAPTHLVNKEEVEVLADDLLPVRHAPKLVGRPFLRQGKQWLILFFLLFPPFIVLGTLWGVSIRQRRLGDTYAQKRDRAKSKALSALDSAEQALSAGETKKASEITSRALRAMVGDVFGMKGEALTPDDFKAELESHKIDKELITEATRLILELEAALFSAAGAANSRSLLTATRALLKPLYQATLKASRSR